MHIFLLWRYYTLSRRTVVSLGLFCMALVTFVLFFASAIRVVTIDVEHRAELRMLIT